MAKIKVSEIRAKFPMYGDVSDDDLIIAVRKKHYSDIPLAKFVQSIDYDTDRAKYGAAKDSFAGNLLPAAGAGMASIGRAVGLGGLMERYGLPGTKEDAALTDQALDQAPGGTTGRVLGSAALLAPTAFIPGANTLAGAAAIGGATGLATTEGDLGDRAAGGLLGTIGGGAGNLLGRGLSAGYRAGKGAIKGLIEPFRESGREAIAGRTLARFAEPADIMAAQGGESLTGAVPTLAEAVRSPRIATLQRAIASMSPEAAESFSQREMANNAARLNALQQVAGTSPVPSRVGALSRIASGQTREAAEAARSAAANVSYGAARRTGVNAPMADAMKEQIANILDRPSIQTAIGQAKNLAKEEGIDLTDMGSVQGLQYVKQSLDDMIGALGPKEKNKIRLLTQTSSDLKSILDEVAPKLRQADAEFMYRSVPVNRAAVGDRLLNSTTGAIRDFAGNRNLQANAFSRALNDEQQLIRQATGRKGAALDDFMTPTQMGRINAVRDELELASNLSRAANGPGSQTAKMLASQNLVRNIAGPLGAPDSWIESTLAQTAMRPLQFGLKTAEERIQQSLTQGLLSPFEAQRLLRIAQNADRATQSELALLARAMAPGLLGYGAAQNAQ